MSKNHNPSSDLRGAGSLTIDAIKGIADLVEAMHHTITSFGGLLGAPGQQRTTGITGMVYRNIRTVTELVGSGIDASLDKLSLIIEEKESSPEEQSARHSDAVSSEWKTIKRTSAFRSDSAIQRQTCNNGARNMHE